VRTAAVPDRASELFSSIVLITHYKLRWSVWANIAFKWFPYVGRTDRWHPALRRRKRCIPLYSVGQKSKQLFSRP